MDASRRVTEKYSNAPGRVQRAHLPGGARGGAAQRKEEGGVTVAELIAELQKIPQNRKVYVDSGDWPGAVSILSVTDYGPAKDEQVVILGNIEIRMTYVARQGKAGHGLAGQG